MTIPIYPFAGKSCAQPGCVAKVSSARPSKESLAPYCSEHRRLRARGLAADGTEAIFAITELPKPEHERARALFTDRYEARKVKVTPGMALAILERNGLNRSVREERVAFYTRDMLANDWEVNNQGIALGSDGQLYDGQHRLWAVVRCGRTVEMLVVSGLSESARATIDHGRTRSVADQLRILDREERASRALHWLRTIDVLHDVPHRQFSVGVARLRLNTYRKAVDWMHEVAPKKRPYHRAPVLGAFMFAHHAIGKQIAVVLNRYVTGEQLGRGAPMLRLREHVVENPKSAGRHEERDTALKTLHAIRLDLAGDTTERLVGDLANFEFFATRVRDRESVKK